MSHHTSVIDFSGWPLDGSSRTASVYSASQESEASGLLMNSFPTPPSPLFSRPSSGEHLTKLNLDTTTLDCHPSVNVSFGKGSRLFKLKFSHINVCKDPHGNIRYVELDEGAGTSSTFVHRFPSSRLPVPHIEQPIISSQAPSYVVSFLEEQTVQTAQTLFSAQPHYTFDDREDWIRFQEVLLDQKLVFVGGIAEAKSRGRGEECISQNLRILRSKTGRQVILLFANSQRKEKKRYISVPCGSNPVMVQGGVHADSHAVDCIDQIEQGKKAGRPVSLRLRPNFDLLSQLKILHIQFLDDNGKPQVRFAVPARTYSPPFSSVLMSSLLSQTRRCSAGS